MLYPTLLAATQQYLSDSLTDAGVVPVPQSFDDLLLMKYGGSVIYHGHLGKRSHRLIEYFKAVPGVPDLQEGLNPATWMLQVSTPGMESTLGVDFAEIYQHSDLFRCSLRHCSKGSCSVTLPSDCTTSS